MPLQVDTHISDRRIKVNLDYGKPVTFSADDMNDVRVAVTESILSILSSYGVG
jgi:hypothetical protein